MRPHGCIVVALARVLHAHFLCFLVLHLARLVARLVVTALVAAGHVVGAIVSPPKLPWEVIATDPFEFGGKDFLLVTDVLSGYPFVVKMGDKTTQTVLRAL
jgi:hypothetical protein